MVHFGILSTSKSKAKFLAEQIGGEESYHDDANYEKNTLAHYHISKKRPLHWVHIWYME